MYEREFKYIYLIALVLCFDTMGLLVYKEKNLIYTLDICLRIWRQDWEY